MFHKAFTGRFLGALLLGAIILLGIASVKFALAIQERQAALERTSRYDVAFSASQAVHEYARLITRIAELAAGNTDVSVDDVALRYAILQNRYKTMDKGEFVDFARDDPWRLQLIVEFKAALDAAGPFIPQADDPAANARLLAILKPLEPDFVGLASEANTYGGNLVANDQYVLLQLHQRFSALTAGLFIASLLLILLLYWNNGLLGKTSSDLKSAATVLEATQDRLRVQNRIFHIALNNMSQGLCMVDSAGRIQVVNRRLFEIFQIRNAAIHDDWTIADLVRNIGKKKRPNLESTILLCRTDVCEEGDQSDIRLSDGSIIQVARRGIADGGTVLTCEDVTERTIAQERVAHLARHDSLTDLPNRNMLQQFIEDALARSARTGEKLALLCLDLDNFKNVNDTLGHATGDKVLRQVGQRISSVCRGGNLVSRIGGDEFVVVQVGVSGRNDPEKLADRIIESLVDPFEIDGKELRTGTSIGIAMAPDNSANAETLLKFADTALYAAKSQGRGRMVFFEKSLQAKLDARQQLELDLKIANFDDEFRIEYQPQVETRSGRIKGVEALLRWTSPRRGDVSPIEFIPVAEEIGMIGRLGEWALKKACADAIAWPDDISLAVNVSPIQFTGDDFVATLSEALAETGLPPHRIELEITESLFLAEDDATLQAMTALKAAGIGIALDDFGTGYSALSYIHKFPIDKIKIDRSFVLGLENDRTQNLEIVRAIVAMADSLGIETIAEGVENEGQLALVAAAGCHQVQGFHFSRSVSTQAILAMTAGDGMLTGGRPLPNAERQPALRVVSS
ncbi:MAG: EAL domain-containing protein [Hyphomicrobiales bacterium]|nr:EAL domain-containing protein [Hyphomicrobiales bacterium]